MDPIKILNLIHSQSSQILNFTLCLALLVKKDSNFCKIELKTLNEMVTNMFIGLTDSEYNQIQKSI